MTGTQRGLYRSRDGIVMGVCKGLADYMDMSALGIRLAVVVLTFFTAILPMIIVYILAALIMKPEPGSQSDL